MELLVRRTLIPNIHRRTVHCPRMADTYTRHNYIMLRRSSHQIMELSAVIQFRARESTNHLPLSPARTLTSPSLLHHSDKPLQEGHLPVHIAAQYNREGGHYKPRKAGIKEHNYTSEDWVRMENIYPGSGGKGGQ
jgi:hypothetical protein